MKILLVGGTWTIEPPQNPEVERQSSLVNFINCALKNYCNDEIGWAWNVDMYNGGCYYDLEMILNKSSQYDVVFWWPNIPDNSLPKIRDVKPVAPHTMLVSSKRNDGDKYSFMELTQRALAVKANLVFEFKREEKEVAPGTVEKLFRMRVFDPLGCQWYDGFDMTSAVYAAMDRLVCLRSMTRQKTIRSDIKKSDVMSSYLANVKENANKSDRTCSVPNEEEFIEIVKKHAETFYAIFNPGKDVKRFLGNASLRGQLNIDSTRCMRGMPSFKKNNMIFVSQRNIDKQFISLENFVPCYMEDGELYYCGDNKPSVDAPIQVRLYEALPHINYIIHSHCYIKDARFTNKTIPCGAIEEVDEVLAIIKTMDNEYLEMAKDTRGNNNAKPFMYAINLKGHGSLLLATNVSMMRNVEYIGRQLPEVMFD